MSKIFTGLSTQLLKIFICIAEDWFLQKGEGT